MNLTGKTLGVYEIREAIGQGGMGAVYKAHDSTLDRFVAVKVLPASLAADESYVARFQHEAKSLAKLQHPNLIHIYAVGEQDGINYFSMELLSGSSLQSILAERGYLPAATTIQIVGQVMAGLHKAHEIGMVHRDIKPANIMLQKEAGGHRAILMDFGLAKEDTSDGLTREGTIIGTPEYMSPEQAQGEVVDLRSDIYSLGVVMYEMLSGKPPFEGKSSFSILRQHVEQEPKPLQEVAPQVPEPLAKIVAKMLAKKREARYPSVIELALALLPLRRTAALLTLARVAQRSGLSDPTAVTEAMSLAGAGTAPPQAPAATQPSARPAAPASLREPWLSGRRKWYAAGGAAAVVATIGVLYATLPSGGTPGPVPADQPRVVSDRAPAKPGPTRPAPPGAPAEKLAIEGGRIVRRPILRPGPVEATVTTQSGKAVSGQLTGFNAQTGQLLIKGNDGQIKPLDFHRIDEIVLKPPTP